MIQIILVAMNVLMVLINILVQEGLGHLMERMVDIITQGEVKDGLIFLLEEFIRLVDTVVGHMVMVVSEVEVEVRGLVETVVDII